MSAFNLSVDELCEFVKTDTQFKDDESLEYIDSYIPKIFEIFSMKNKKHCYNNAIDFCKKIIDFVNPWFYTQSYKCFMRYY